MRMEVESQGFGLARDEFDAAFSPLARQHGMNWRVRYTGRPRRVAIMVSKYAHCLLDLLWRWEAGELETEIPLVISNIPTWRRKSRPTASRLCTCPSPRGQGRAGGPGRETPEGAQRRPGRAGPLHADPLGRIPRRTAGRSSTSTTRSCRRSSAPVRTTGLWRRREDHRHDGAYSPPSSTPGRSSTRTSPTSPSRRRRGHDPHRPRGRAPRSGPGRAMAPRGPFLVDGVRTVVFS